MWHTGEVGGGTGGYHFGDQHRRFAHDLIDRAGIDVVHGYSSHHPRAIEVYRDRPLETARILENQGANPFRVRAYRRAARTLQQLRRPVEQILREEGVGGLDRLAGIGPGLAAAISSYVATGRMPLQERLLSTQAIGGELVTIPGVGPALACRLRDELGVVTLEDLEVAAYDGRLEKVSGIGPRRLDGPGRHAVLDRWSGLRDGSWQPLRKVKAYHPIRQGHTRFDTSAPSTGLTAHVVNYIVI